LQLLLDLLRRGIGHRGSVGEDEGRDGAISTVDLLDDLSSSWNFLDVDLFEGNADVIELALESLAVAAPLGAVHRERHCLLLGSSPEPITEVVSLYREEFAGASECRLGSSGVSRGGVSGL